MLMTQRPPNRCGAPWPWPWPVMLLDHAGQDDQATESDHLQADHVDEDVMVARGPLLWSRMLR